MKEKAERVDKEGNEEGDDEGDKEVDEEGEKKVDEEERGSGQVILNTSRRSADTQ